MGAAQRMAQIAEVLADVALRRDAGQAVPSSDVLHAHPDLRPELDEQLEALTLAEEARQVAEQSRPRMHSDSGSFDIPGDALPGYQIVREIGRGGQGVVLEALQLSTQRRVALKVMRPSTFSGAPDHARFAREAQILAQLRHPNIVTIHESGRAGDATYLVMDFVDGPPLNRWLERRAELKQHGEREARLQAFLKICQAVNAAHIRGVIHRDLKPGNILLRGDEPVVLDFGLAKTDEVSTESVMTLTGQFVGSLPWASPEQTSGESGAVDIRTDVYALGVILYQTLTGTFPYAVQGSLRRVIDAIQHQNPQRPSRIASGVDDELDTIVLKCLAKQPERRYQSAGELARDLQRYLANEPIEAKRDSALYVLRKNLQRYRWPIALTLLFGLILFSSTLVAWTLYGRARTSEVDAVERLWHANLERARAVRLANRPGRRVDALAALGEAAEIRPDPQLRGEAIAALALRDLEPLDSVAIPRTNHALVASQDERAIVLTLDDRIELIDLTDGEVLWETTQRPAHYVRAFGPAGRYAMISYRHDDGAMIQELWDLQADRVLHQSTCTGRWSGYRMCSPEEGIIVLGSGSDYILVGEVGLPPLRIELPVRPRLYGLSPDRRHLAVASRDSGVWIVRTSDGALLHCLPLNTNIHDMAWTPDSQQLTVASEPDRISTWNLHGNLVSELRHPRTPVHLDYSQDGQLLFSDAWGSKARMWDARNGALLLELNYAWPVFSNRDRMVTSRRNTTSGARLHRFRLLQPTGWNHWISSEARLLHGEGLDARLAPDGGWGTLSSEHGVTLFSSSGQQLARLPLGVTRQVVFRPQHQDLLTIGRSGIFRWALAREGTHLRIGPPQRVWKKLRSGMTGIAGLSGDGNRLVFVERVNAPLIVLDLRDGSHSTIDPRDGIAFVDLHPDGNLLAVGTWHYDDVLIWDIARDTQLARFEMPGWSWPRFSPDGRWLAVGRASGTTLIRTTDWEPEAEFPYETSNQSGARPVFSPDGNLLAVSDRPAAQRLIDLENLETVTVLQSPVGAFVPGGFDRTGTQLVGNLAAGERMGYWDLRGLRQALQPLQLDWEERAETSPRVLPVRTIEVDLGSLQQP